MSDKEIIDGYLAGRNDDHQTITSWMMEVVNARAWEDTLSKDDIIAESAFKLLVNFRDGKFKFESSLKTYVQRITMFTLIDSVRRQRRERDYLGKENPVPVESKNPFSLLEEKEDLLIFHRIFLNLEAMCRELWILILHEGLNYKQVAERLQIAEGTVKTRMFRCKEKAIAIRARIQ